MLKTYATHFCGLGGACYGIEQAGLKCKLAIDYWEPALIAREKNLGHKGFCMDIGEYKPDNSHAADLLWTSPPCQTFSTSSRENHTITTEDDRDTLFEKSVKYLDIFKPKYFVLENVTGMLTHDSDGMAGGTLNNMRKYFKEHGYETEWGVLNSKYFGLAQSRERVFIVGSRDGKKNLLPQEPTKATAKFGDIMEKETIDCCWAGETYRTALNKVARTGVSIDVITQEDILPTITCGWGGGATRKKVAILDSKNDINYLRHPTIREGARAQGFPDSWQFSDNKTDAWQMIGNAVSSPVAKVIIEHLQGVEAGKKQSHYKQMNLNSYTRRSIPDYLNKMGNDLPPEIKF